jgi:hypothetical protein
MVGRVAPSGFEHEHHSWLQGKHMKTASAFAGTTIALLFAVGNVQAQVPQRCGQVIGSLASPDWTAAVELPTNVACAAGSNSFSFVVTDPDLPEDVSFSVSAAFNSPMVAGQAVTLDLGMIFGLTGGFQENATWSFSLAGSGLVFADTVKELSDTFTNVEGNEARFVGFGPSWETATFELVLANGFYDPTMVTSVGASYSMDVIAAVPEPETWILVLSAIGILAFVKRKPVI